MALTITHIQPFSLHDGPGVRTTVFLAGCPLSCVWCHNPEARHTRPLLIYDKKRCAQCRACAAVCPNNAHRFEKGTHSVDRTRCQNCTACVSTCPSGALSVSVRTLHKDEYQQAVARQARLVGDNGGITFSGGEPLYQGETLIEYLEETPLHKAIETCGYADEELFYEVIRRCDFIMFDIKLADDTLHRQYTGVSNQPILNNLERLRQSGKPFVLRTPLIPGITDTSENLAQIENIVDQTPFISDLQKKFYKTMLRERKERILDFSYRKLCKRERTQN